MKRPYGCSTALQFSTANQQHQSLKHQGDVSYRLEGRSRWRNS